MMSDGLNSLAKSPFSPGARVMSEDATITFLGIQDGAMLHSDPEGDFTVHRLPGPRIGSSPVRRSTGNQFGGGRRPPATARRPQSHGEPRSPRSPDGRRRPALRTPLAAGPDRGPTGIDGRSALAQPRGVKGGGTPPIPHFDALLVRGTRRQRPVSKADPPTPRTGIHSGSYPIPASPAHTYDPRA